MSKSLVLTATANNHHMIPFLILLLASAGVLHHSGIKIPFFAFFACDSGIRCREAPRHMLLAMGITAFLCVAIGVFPQPLYSILPFAVDYQPYTLTHVITQYQLLLFFVLCFGVLELTGRAPHEMRSTNLDTDWVYRRALPWVWARMGNAWAATSGLLAERFSRELARSFERVYRYYGPQGIFARTWTAGSTVLWVGIMLAAFLLLYYL